MAVLNVYRDRIPAEAVYVGRRGSDGRWGNPFVVGRDGNAERVVELYRQELLRRVRDGEVRLEALAALKGKDLVCHCAPRPCHGGVLERAAEWAHEELGGPDPRALAGWETPPISETWPQGLRRGASAPREARGGREHEPGWDPTESEGARAYPSRKDMATPPEANPRMERDDRPLHPAVETASRDAAAFGIADYDPNEGAARGVPGARGPADSVRDLAAAIGDIAGGNNKLRGGLLDDVLGRDGVFDALVKAVRDRASAAVEHAKRLGREEGSYMVDEGDVDLARGNARQQNELAEYVESLAVAAAGWRRSGNGAAEPVEALARKPAPAPGPDALRAARIEAAPIPLAATAETFELSWRQREALPVEAWPKTRAALDKRLDALARVALGRGEEDVLVASAEYRSWQADRKAADAEPALVQETARSPRARL